jgi:DNA-directed RNA polymerase subunit RPC12/RpoP
MMTMVCENCGRTGIRWMGALSNLTHTECPHCGGINCQRVDGRNVDESATEFQEDDEQ